MVQEIKDKVVVITGAARGIGLAMAEEFLKEAAKVVVLIDVKADKGTEAAISLNNKYGHEKAIFIKGDVTTDLDDIFAEVIGKYNTVDILVNNAGVIDETRYKLLFQINTIALIEWTTKFFRHMRKDKGGRGGTILNVSSIYGHTIDHNVPMYKASKYAVMGFSKSAGHVKNFNMTGVKVVTLCPGYTHTELQQELKPHEEFKIVDEVTAYEEQTVDVVGKAALEVITTKPSGSAWSIVGGKPIVEV